MFVKGEKPQAVTSTSKINSHTDSILTYGFPELKIEMGGVPPVHLRCLIPRVVSL